MQHRGFVIQTLKLVFKMHLYTVKNDFSKQIKQLRLLEYTLQETTISVFRLQNIMSNLMCYL